MKSSTPTPIAPTDADTENLAAAADDGDNLAVAGSDSDVEIGAQSIDSGLEDPSPGLTADTFASDETIRLGAYERYLERQNSGIEGSEIEDWLEAERALSDRAA